MIAGWRYRFERALLATGLLSLSVGSGCEMDEEDDAPAIVWTANRPHADRGECTRCHVRLDLAGNPLPMIASWARMPHADRGVCTNCHLVSRGGGGIGPADPVRLTSAVGVVDRIDWLGMNLQVVAPGQSAQVPAGLLVIAVRGAAVHAGVQTGDLLTSVNGAPIATFADVSRIPTDKPIQLGVMRAGRPITLALRPADALPSPAVVAAPAAAAGTNRYF